MAISGILKKNKEKNIYEFKGNENVSKKTDEEIEELKKKYKEKISFNQDKVKISLFSKDGKKTLFYNLSLEENEIEERVKKQLEIVGEKGLATALDETTKKVDNVTSKIIAPNSVGGVLKNNFKPNKLAEDNQTINLKGNLYTNKREFNGKETEQNSLSIRIPLMNKEGNVYSDNTIKELKDILEGMGVYAKTTTYEGKTFLNSYINLANNAVLKELKNNLNPDENFVELTINLKTLINKGTQYIKRGEPIRKSTTNTEETHTEETHTEETTKPKPKKYPNITF